MGLFDWIRKKFDRKEAERIERTRETPPSVKTVARDLRRRFLADEVEPTFTPAQWRRRRIRRRLEREGRRNARR